MPLITSTPLKTLFSCDTDPAALFSVRQNGCDLELLNESSLVFISDITYEISLGSTLVQTISGAANVETWEAAALFSGETVSIEQTITASAGTFTYTLEVNVPDFADSCYFSFQSNMAAGATFDPSVITAVGQTPYWRLPDNVVRTGNISVLGSSAGFDGTTKEIRLTATDALTLLQSPDFRSDSIVGILDFTNWVTIGSSFQVFSNPGLNTIFIPTSSQIFSAFYAYNCNLTGTLDLSGLSGLGGAFIAYGNPNLTSIVNPVSTQVFTSYQVFSCNLTGTLDLSGLTGLGGVFNTRINANLTSIVNPTSTQVFTRYEVNTCDLTGTLDLSGLTGLGGFFSARTNPNLTSIVNPTSTQVFTQYEVNNCNLTGTLDLSSLTGLGGVFIARTNPNLTSIVNPTSTQVFTSYQVFSCNLTGTLDVSSLTGLGGVFIARTNPNLTSIVNPTSTQVFTEYDVSACDLGHFDITTLVFSSAIEFAAQNNAMTAAEVNEMLVDLDATVPVTGTGTIQIDGTNAAPDTTSGGFNGVAAAASLAGKGYTVITS